MNNHPPQRNLIYNSGGTLINNLNSASGSRKEYAVLNLGNSYMGVASGTTVTLSFDIEYQYNSVAYGGAYFSIYNTNNKGPKQMAQKIFKLNEYFGDTSATIGDTLTGRVVTQTTITDRSDANKSDNYIEFYSNYGSSNWFKISNIMMSYGSPDVDGDLCYTWRPAPEDIVAFDWMVLSRNSLTVSMERDITSATWYYLLQSSTLTPPSKPTTATPTGWTTTEPAYVTGSTNSLYVCEKTTFSDGTFEYSDVSLSSSYEAAKAAYNKAETASTEIRAVNQYFWHTTTGDDAGAHITEVPKDEWNDSTSENYHSGGNLLATSDGIVVRDGLDTLATFGSTVTVGKENSGRLALDSSRMQMVAEDDSVVFDVHNEMTGEAQVENVIYTGTNNVITISHPLAYDVTLYEPKVNDVVTTHYTKSETISGGVKKITYTFDTDYLAIRDQLQVSWYYEGVVSNYTIGLRDGAVDTSSRWSTVIGYANQARGHASIATGAETTAGDYAAHSEGWLTKAIGPYSHAEGRSSQAGSEGAHAEGHNTIASGKYSHAEGFSSWAIGDYAHAEGGHARGRLSHSEGSATNANALASHAEGSTTTAGGNYSHAEGDGTTASGSASHAEGNDTTASGNYSHAEGTNNGATNEGAHAEGNHTTASGASSHAEGSYNEASGTSSHVEGANNVASGLTAHAEGDYSVASGDRSHAGGWHTIAAGGNQMAIGQYNVEDTNGHYAFIIGNGTADNARANAFAVAWNGDVVLGKSPITTVTGTSIELDHNASKTLTSITLDKGSYILVGVCRYAANANGYRTILFANTGDTYSAYDSFANLRIGASQSSVTYMQLTWAVEITTNDKTIYLCARQNSGSTLTVDNIGIRAIRLG